MKIKTRNGLIREGKNYGRIKSLLAGGKGVKIFDFLIICNKKFQKFLIIFEKGILLLS